MSKEAQEKIEIEKALTNGKHLPFLLHSGIQFVDTRTVAELIHRIIRELGYHKPPEGEMPILSDEEIKKAVGIETKRIFTLMDELALDYIPHTWWNQWLLFQNALAKKIIESPVGIRQEMDER